MGMVDTEGREALISAVYHHVKGNAALVIVKVRGLNAQVYYQINLNMEICRFTAEDKGLVCKPFIL